jgi:hypothetical protein
MNALEQLDRTILLCRDHVAETISDEEICQILQSTQILCVSDAPSMSSHSGQTAIVTLVSLLNRMGMQVGLAIPDVPMLLPQPPLLGPSLAKALTASSETLIVGAKVRHDSDFSPDVIFVLGNVKLDNDHAVCWRLSGSDWYGTLAMEGVAQPIPWTAKWPVGLMVSAALAANEAFKFAMRRMPFRNEADRVFFEPSRTSHWDFGPLPLIQQIVDFGPVDIISAGAISQACLYAMMRFPNVQMRGRIFDDDVTGPSNLNRNMLTVANDVGSSKVEIIAEHCGPNLHLRPVATRFTCESSNLDKLAPHVLVGVDDIPSRWNVQRAAPGWVAVSGTSHFSVSSSSHSPGSACSGCLHPVDDLAASQIPTVSFVSFWAGLAMAVRLFREAIGSPYSSDRQHLWLTPLRMDQPHAAMWLPVPPHRDCPVQCMARSFLHRRRRPSRLKP